MKLLEDNEENISQCGIEGILTNSLEVKIIKKKMNKFVSNKDENCYTSRHLKHKNTIYRYKEYVSNIEVNTNKYKSNSFKMEQMIYRTIYRREILQNQ